MLRLYAVYDMRNVMLIIFLPSEEPASVVSSVLSILILFSRRLLPVLDDFLAPFVLVFFKPKNQYGTIWERNVTELDGE